MKPTQEQLDQLAKKYGGVSIKVGQKTAEDKNVVLAPDRHTHYAAFFRLLPSDFSKLERPTIGITEEADDVIVIVKAVGSMPDGSNAWFGDHFRANKSEPISNILNSIKSAFENVEKMINEV